MISRFGRVLSRSGFALGLGLVFADAARAEPGFVSPASGSTLAAGEVVEIRWMAPCETDADEIELVLSTDAGRTFPVRVTASMPECATQFRWRVPRLPASHARLAVRSGTKAHPESERLTLVSEEFSILATEREDLVPGAGEWWTLQALTETRSEDLLLGDELTGQEPRITRERPEPELDESHSPTVPPPVASRVKLPASDASRPPHLRAARPAGRACPVPLRV